MPELPEVETVVRGLTPHLVGQKITGVTATPWPNNKNRVSLITSGHRTIGSIVGHRVVALSRRGKGLIIDLEGSVSLLIHLKMTGQLIYVDDQSRLNFGHPDDNFKSSMPSRHTRVIFQLTHGALYFNDQRLFGWIKLLPTSEIGNDPFIKKLGPEPLSKDFSEQTLWSAIQRRPKSSIKSIIMDQSVVTGVGNIYADEALFASKILPMRAAHTITAQETALLTKSIKRVLATGIKYNGTSISHYKTGEGALGKMQHHLRVYGRTDLPCRVCGNPTLKTRTAGRGTHYCKTCQH